MITFREVLEAALITAIILSYLIRTGRRSLTRYVWYGVYLATALSLGLGVSVWLIYGALPKTVQLLFESSAAFIAVAVLSSMIYWMAVKGRYLKREMEQRIEAIATRGAIVGLVSISLIVVFREGLETVLFLTPFLLEDAVDTLVGSLLGAVMALILAYAVFVGGMKIDLHKFFYFTSILLILLAGGLAGYGVHELLEYYERVNVEVGWLGEPAYVLNIPKGDPLHHKGLVGSIFAVMFGYTVKAEWARVIIHVAYLAVALPLVIWVYKRPVREPMRKG